MRDILKTEAYVPVPPETMDDPFYSMARIIKEEIRKVKWTQAEMGHTISWEDAHRFWMQENELKIDTFIRNTLERDAVH